MIKLLFIFFYLQVTNLKLKNIKLQLKSLTGKLKKENTDFFNQLSVL